MTPAPSLVEREPDRRRRSFTCPHCGAFAAQDWRELGYQVHYDDHEPSFTLTEDDSPATTEPVVDAWGNQGPNDVWAERGTEADRGIRYVVKAPWAQSKCQGCSHVATWRHEQIMYPHSSPIAFAHPDMPEHVLPVYDEARSVVKFSRRGSAALARATMEMLLRELDPDAPKNAKLDQRILRVEDRLSSGLVELLTFIRHVGNQALHVSGAPDDAVVLILNSDDSDPVEAIFEAINQLVDELKTKPARNRRLSEMVPEGMKRAVDKQRQAASDATKA
jgi:hypothetical protein